MQRCTRPVCRECDRGVPHMGERCPRCHRLAPRSDGVVCALCAPKGYNGLTYTEPATGITHAMKGGCEDAVLLGHKPMRWINVGHVNVTCLACIATKPDRFMSFEFPEGWWEQ